MTTAQPGQEQRMERCKLCGQFYEPCIECGTRPTADLGEDDELIKLLRAVAPDSPYDDSLTTQAADRLILCTEVLVEVREAVVAGFDLIAGSRAADKGPTHAEASLRLAISKIDGVLSRSGH